MGWLFFRPNFAHSEYPTWFQLAPKFVIKVTKIVQKVLLVIFE